MNSKKIESVLNLSTKERYLYFIRKIADFEEVWGLYNDGWALLSDGENNEVIPFWPESEFAEICAVGKWSSYEPKSIDVYSFKENWLTGMQEDNKKVGVFYTPQGKGIIASPNELKAELNEELSQYD
jgi:hypothetical protein